MKKIEFRCSKCNGLMGWIECVDNFDLDKAGVNEALCKECGKEDKKTLSDKQVMILLRNRVVHCPRCVSSVF